MTVDHIDVDATLKTVRQLLAEEAHLSPALRSILEVMIMRVKLMANRLSLNSRNSSQPPSTDGFTKDDKADKADADKQSGGQTGRVGTTLKKTDPAVLLLTLNNAVSLAADATQTTTRTAMADLQAYDELTTGLIVSLLIIGIYAFYWLKQKA